MGNRYDELERVNKELRENDPNGTMTKNPGGNRRATRESMNEYLRIKGAGKGIITNPDDAQKAGKAAALKKVEQAIKRHNKGMEPGD